MARLTSSSTRSGLSSAPAQDAFKGLPSTVPGSGSFHPNANRQQNFAELISECLELNTCPVGPYYA
jgi:hypothetical protein